MFRPYEGSKVCHLKLCIIESAYYAQVSDFDDVTKARPSDPMSSTLGFITVGGARRHSPIATWAKLLERGQAHVLASERPERSSQRLPSGNM